MSSGTVRQLVLASLFFLLGGQRAHGSGFFISQIGGPDAAPTEPDPTAVFWNPAALGDTEALEVQLDLVSILRQASYTRSIGYEWDVPSKAWRTVPGAERSATLFNYIPVPFLGASYRLGSRVVLALAGYSAFGASSSWDSDGPQRYHSISGSNYAIFVSPAASVRIIDALHAGITLSYVRTLLSSERKAEFSDIIAGLPEDPSLLATLRLSGFAGDTFSAEAGLYLDLGKLRAGIAYQPPIPVTNTGRVVLEPEGEKLREVIGKGEAQADAEMTYTLPDNLKASVDYFVRPGTRLRLYGEWVHWSRFDAIRLELARRTNSLLPETMVDAQEFHDAFALRAQVKHWLGPRLALFAGLSYDSSAVPDETLCAVFIDSDKIAASLGADLLAWGSLRAKAAVQYVHFFERSVEGSTRAPSADGRYGADLVMIDLNLNYSLPRGAR